MLKRPTARLARALLAALDVPHGSALVERRPNPARFVVVLSLSAWRSDMPLYWRGYPIEYRPPSRRRRRTRRLQTLEDSEAG